MATTVLAGRYKIRHKLGRGGMATVYEAHDDLLDRDVAIKMLRNEALSEHTARQRFAAEARAAASLTHPHAVAVYDVHSGEEQPFIVMELVRGRTLQDLLDDEGAIDETRVVAVGSQVLAALHAAHRRGLVHRDVKPANILLPDGVVPTRPEELPGVKLADFGIAKATADATAGLTMVGQVIGTPKYLSPEQVKGQRATAQSDLYATGVVLYEMLAGRPPFEHDSAVGLALAHREDEPPPLRDVRPDVDRNLAAVVHRALSKDPAGRPPDANAMRDELIAATGGGAPGTHTLDGAPASTQVMPAGHPFDPDDAGTATAATTPARHSGRLAWWLVALALLGILALLAVQWLGDRTDTEPDANDGQEPAGQEPGGDGAADPDPDPGDGGADPDPGDGAADPNPDPDPGDGGADPDPGEEEPEGEAPAEPTEPAGEEEPQPSE